MKTKIYMDNAATTPVREEVLAEVLPYFREHYGNASSVYAIAKESKKAMEQARKQVADAIGAKPEEIYFTAGGSESDNMALRGVAEAMSSKGNHIITTKIEHHAILHTCQYLEKHGFEVTYLDVDEMGKVRMEELEKAIRPETILISVMFANNEIGTIQPIAQIGALAKEKGIYFHTDAVQAVGHVPVNVEEMQIDLLSMSGHKLGAPKGIGAIYIRKGVKISPLIFGGAQEKKMRAGTENIPGIVGLGKAAELAVAELEQTRERLTALRDKLIHGILEKIPYSRLNGDPVDRLPGNCNISFAYIEGESMLLLLDALGIAASSGSACTSGSLDPSHVLLAIGLPHEEAHGSLRLTLDRENTEEEVDFVLEKLPAIVQRLREMSPLYEDMMKK
ncbi:cysteine desulfurase NifS [Anaerotignum lactatifermentans]|uniref:Cysteine desulfurase IscS n=1 Tax=Anaerotignum lactatifermentans TaxID=160404 RepID=A0ABS2G8G5_9FIRM|nr:cysteine desulfurase NifS [Anaerotignum lactatifermentans]MBM6828068.1 cysteine desulfurase NifS [Anaerotignum lactatifermentans]MBM6876769.1 cysteine desulfurase NifS [Anaerotignum lactatifermentans]MBM6949651.1 cysteine desulfurase NifS [Anaerotignum lactatifermentans]